MYSTILVPTDGSDGAEAAIDRAFDFARRFGASVRVLYVADTGSEPVGVDRQQLEPVRRSTEKRGREATARARERATELGLEATRAVREGVPHRSILEYVDENDVDLIVMGMRGRTEPERVQLGSTTERVIALADIPVVAVPPIDGEDVGLQAIDLERVVIATDGSDVAERAAERGLELAESYRADVHVVYVIDTTTYALQDAPGSIVGLLKEGGRNAVEAVAAECRDRGLSTETDVLRGVPDEKIAEYADGVGGDLLVMGTRGQGGASGALMGSTTDRVLRRTPCPILSVS